MNRRTRLLPGLLMAGVVTFGIVGCDVESEPAEDTQVQPAPQEPMMDHDMDQEMYEARIQSVNNSGVTGTATVTVEDDRLQITVAATGLEPNTRVPQHIHMNASCDDAGGIWLNLDDELSLPGDGEAQGDAYPETDDEGRLRYEASRSLEDLRTALGGIHAAEGQDTVRAGTSGQSQMGSEGAAAFDLGNRVVSLHGPNMQAVGCGPLDRMDHSQTGQPVQPGQTTGQSY